jgi:hypothetical protein
MRLMGRHLDGSRKFGYAIVKAKDKKTKKLIRTLEKKPDEQRAIRLIRQWRQRGDSLRAIQQRVQSRLGLTISHMSVQEVLRREPVNVKAVNVQKSTGSESERSRG